jgi:hypothetical protein
MLQEERYSFFVNKVLPTFLVSKHFASRLTAFQKFAGLQGEHLARLRQLAL